MMSSIRKDMLETSKRLKRLDAAHHLHPFSHLKDVRDQTKIITEAHGVYLNDSDGNKYLDAMSGLWCVNMGYGRQELVDAATNQLQQLPYYNSFFKTSHPPAAELSALLAEIAPSHINHTFFTNSGSEANDTNLRMVRRYWELLGQPEKNIIISRENAYHGSTVAASSLGGMSYMHTQGGRPIPNIEHIIQPHVFEQCCEQGKNIDANEFGLVAARALETKILEVGIERVAAFIAEPIQGAGGVIIPPESYWPEISRICDEYNILLIADEVICGFGRTGKWFGSDYYNIKPDLMTIAKGVSSGYLPIGGVMVSDRVVDVLMNKGGEFNHGFTYSGHPACCAVAIANIKLMQEEDIVNKVHNDTAPYLQQKLQTLAGHPLVGDVSGLGMLGALHLVKNKNTLTVFDEDDKAGEICRDYCIDNNLIMRATGDRMIVAPPLVINHAEIDELVNKAKTCLDLTAEKLGLS